MAGNPCDGAFRPGVMRRADVNGSPPRRAGWRCVLVGAGVLLLAATAACGERGAPGSPQATISQPNPGAPVTHGAPDSARPTSMPCSVRQPCAKGPFVPASRLDATAWPAKTPPKVWSESGGHTVAIPVTHGVCERLHGERASTSSRVRITVVTKDTSGGQPCTLQAVLDTVRVQLRHPLGDRTLVLAAREER